MFWEAFIIGAGAMCGVLAVVLGWGLVAVLLGAKK